MNSACVSEMMLLFIQSWIAAVQQPVIIMPWADYLRMQTATAASAMTVARFDMLLVPTALHSCVAQLQPAYGILLFYCIAVARKLASSHIQLTSALRA